MKLEIAILALTAMTLSPIHATETQADADAALPNFAPQADAEEAAEARFLRIAVRDAETKKLIQGAKITGNAFIPFKVEQSGKVETQLMGMFINATADSNGDISVDVGKVAQVVNFVADVTADGYANGAVKKHSFDFKLPIIVFMKKEQ